MMRYLVSLQLTVTTWRDAVSTRARGGDTGAVTTETVIITALLGGAALALAVYLANSIIPGWQSEIPTSGGG